jgi:hypothetical protein
MFCCDAIAFMPIGVCRLPCTNNFGYWQESLVLPERLS